jgi:hypothetical protein
VQEAPEPIHFWATANVGLRCRLRSREDQFSQRQIVFTHITTAELCAAFEVGESTVHAKARVIEETLGTRPLDPQWTLPSLAGRNSLVWIAEVNGLLVDLRDMPREVQEIAFAKGLIPYIPTDRKDRL